MATEVALLTGDKDKPYAYGLAKALASTGLSVDVVCGDELDIPELRNEQHVKVINIRRASGLTAGIVEKTAGVLRLYARLIQYAWSSTPKIFHVLWNNKFDIFDRVFLTLYYRCLNKRIVLTAHNINAGDRDGTDTIMNRLTLRFQYRLAEHVFVHTAKMKSQLVNAFGVSAASVTVIPFGINNSVPQTDLTRADARRRLGINSKARAILFFGNIAPYKGLEYLVDAFRKVAWEPGEWRLIIAGRPKGGFESYWEQLRQSMGEEPEKHGFILKIEFVPDEQTELYFKAADVVVLPYVQIFQSGVLSLAYTFGLPVLAADVGSLRDEIIEGKTGFVFTPQDSVSLADALRVYFDSDLFEHLDERRRTIRAYATARYSWEPIAETIHEVYDRVLRDRAVLSFSER